MSKRRIKSRTHWFNGVMAALFAAELNIGVLQPLVPVDVFAIFSFALIIGNSVLREMTNTSIGREYRDYDDSGSI